MIACTTSACPINLFLIFTVDHAVTPILAYIALNE